MKKGTAELKKKKESGVFGSSKREKGKEHDREKIAPQAYKGDVAISNYLKNKDATRSKKK